MNGISEIVYRQASAEDSIGIARLSGQLGYPAAESRIRDRMLKVLGHPEHIVFVALDGDTVAGWIHAQGRYLLESEPFAELVGLVVDERRRSRGIGKRLALLCETWACSAGLDKIRVRTNERRPDAIAFYTRIGYMDIKNQRVLDKKLKAPGTVVEKSC